MIMSYAQCTPLYNYNFEQTVEMRYFEKKKLFSNYELSMNKTILI